jgi:hypothetical protein
VVCSSSLSFSFEDEFASAGGGETLLLVQSVLLTILIEALLPLDHPLLRKGRPVSLPLLRGAAGGL